MRFNTDKCKTLHFGYANVKTEYLLGDEVVTTDGKEKDLGVIIHQTLKSNSQCVAAANSANRTLGMINRTIVNKENIIKVISVVGETNWNTVYKHGGHIYRRI